MARMKSFLGLQGSMGETTFKKVGKKHIAQDKLNVPKSKREKNEKFASARKNSDEFKIAADASTLLRTSLSVLLHNAGNAEMANNLNAKMMKMLRLNHYKDISLLARLLPQNMGLLLGHNFNSTVTLRSVINTRYNTTTNRATGELTINIPSFKPSSCIKPARFATHFKIVSTAVEIDFENGTQKSYTYSSEVMSLKDNLTNALTITHEVTPASTQILLIVLGLVFSDESNTHYSTEVERRKVNPLCIVDMDIIATTII